MRLDIHASRLNSDRVAIVAVGSGACPWYRGEDGVGRYWVQVWLASWPL